MSSPREYVKSQKPICSTKFKTVKKGRCGSFLSPRWDCVHFWRRRKCEVRCGEKKSTTNCPLDVFLEWGNDMFGAFGRKKTVQDRQILPGNQKVWNPWKSNPTIKITIPRNLFFWNQSPLRFNGLMQKTIKFITFGHPPEKTWSGHEPHGIFVAWMKARGTTNFWWMVWCHNSDHFSIQSSVPYQLGNDHPSWWWFQYTCVFSPPKLGEMNHFGCL